MAVVFDTVSGPGGSGTNGHIFSGTANASPVTTSATFFNPSVSSSIIVIGVAMNDSLAAIGTMSMNWDPTGVNKSMSLIGSVQTTTAGQSIFYFGLISPGTSAAKAARFSWTGSASGDVYEIYGISFTGSITSSVAAATEGFQTATGSSTSASVTTSAAIPTGDMITAWFVSNGSAFSATNNTNIDLDATQFDVACSRASGAGSTIASTATLSPTTNWAAMVVGIKASTTVSIGLQPSTLLLPPMGQSMVGWRGLRQLQAFPPQQAGSAFPTVPGGIIMIGS